MRSKEEAVPQREAELARAEELVISAQKHCQDENLPVRSAGSPLLP